MSKCMRCGRTYRELPDEQGDHDCPGCNRLNKMRIIAKERFGSSVNYPWFLCHAIKSFDTDDGCFGMQCMEKGVWIAAFHGKGNPDFEYTGEGDSALDAVVDLLWNMGGHA